MARNPRFRPALTLVFALAIALNGCSVPRLPGSNAGQGGPAAWTGTITMFAQHYTPNKRGDDTPLKMFRIVADEYERNHPGVKIEFIDEDFQGYDQVVRDKAAAGELWDVFWAQWRSLNSILPPDIAVDLAPHFEQPNPYIPGAASWQAAMNQTVVDETAAPNGAHYNINGDFVATAFFYNQALFDQAGIAAPPAAWPDLIAASEQLADSGIPAVVHVPLFSWWQRHFLSDFYAGDYDTIAGFDGAPGISALDEAVAIDQGILSPEDPRFMGWWPLFKDLTQYWVQDYIDRPVDENEAALQDFIGGRAAMIYSGSWLPNRIKDANPAFELGSFSFPTLSDAVTEFSTNTNTSNAVGGPNAGFQYAMSTPQSNKTMAEPGKPEAVLDWLHYIGTPGVIERIVNEDGSYIPTWPGTRPPPGVAALAPQADQKLRAIWVGSAAPGLDAGLQNVFGSYLSGAIDIDQATAEVQALLQQAAQDYATRNGVDLDTYD